MDHSEMYRSNASRQVAAISRRSLNQKAMRRNQKMNRLESFQNNRVIELTPEKRKTPAKPKNSVKRATAVNPVISQQQIFRQRFKQYIEQKQKQKDEIARKKNKPFVSAVAIGRFTDNQKVETKPVAEKKKNAALVSKPAKLKMVAQSSPIKTRSKSRAIEPESHEHKAENPISDTPKGAPRSRAAPKPNTKIVPKISPKKAVKEAAPKEPKAKTATERALAALKKTQPNKTKTRRSPLISAAQSNSSVGIQRNVASNRKFTTNMNKSSGSELNARSIQKENKPNGSNSNARAMPTPKENKPAKTAVVARSQKVGPTASNSKATQGKKPAIKIGETTLEDFNDDNMDMDKSSGSELSARSIQKENKPNASNSDARAMPTPKENKPAKTAVVARSRKVGPTASNSKATQGKKPANVPAIKIGKTTLEDSNIFKPSDLISSTVVKPKRPQSQAAKIFDDTISPINNTFDQTLLEKSLPKIEKNRQPNTPILFKPPIIPDISTQNTATPERQMDSTNILPNINYVSPFVTISRGKQTKRIETAARQSMCRSNETSLNEAAGPVKLPQNAEAAKYFRIQMQHEIDRFANLTEKWQAYVALPDSQENLPSEYKDLIDVTLGQTRLLTTSKFKQFSGLVDQFEEGKSTTRAEDLEGFWTMVYLQVDNCNLRFERLDQLKKNNWIDPALNVSKVKKIRTAGITIGKTKAVQKRPNNALQAMLHKARQHLKESQKQADNQVIDVISVKTLRSSIANIKANDSMTRRSFGTPRKSLWVVEDNVAKGTPMRGILKTPGSIRKHRMTLTIKNSPEVLLFSKENATGASRKC